MDIIFYFLTPLAFNIPYSSSIKKYNFQYISDTFKYKPIKPIKTNSSLKNVYSFSFENQHKKFLKRNQNQLGSF